jgi:hypothetical protein
MRHRIYKYLLITYVFAALSVPLACQDALASYTIKVFEIKFCDDDGNNCSTATEVGLQGQLDIANEVFERPKLPFQFIIHPATDFNIFVIDSDANSNCTIADKYTPGHVLCEDPCVDTNNDGLKDGIPHDANGDNTDGDKEDQDYICNPNEEWDNRLNFHAEYYQDLHPDAIILVSPGNYRIPKYKKFGTCSVTTGTSCIEDADCPATEECEFDDYFYMWYMKWAGGFSGCRSSRITMSSRGGGGTFFAHEGGHYFCLPHSFYDREVLRYPSDVDEAALMIKDYVELNDIDPLNHQEVLKVFDGDYEAWKFDADLDGVPDQLYIKDTPPDPGATLIASVNGTCSLSTGISCSEDADCPATEECEYDYCGPIDSVQVEVKYDDYPDETYELRPDRNLVISYFKFCPFDLYHSEDQAIVISANLFSENLRLTQAQFQGVQWTEFEYSGLEEWGTYYHPFNSLAEGINAVEEGNKLMIKKGTTSVTPILFKKMVIDAYMGSVVIGR